MTWSTTMLAELEAARAERRVAIDDDLDSLIEGRWIRGSVAERAELLVREVFYDAKFRRRYGR